MLVSTGSASVLLPFRSPMNSGSVRYAAIASRSSRSSSHSHRGERNASRALSRLNRMHREQKFLSRSWNAYLSLIEESPLLAVRDGRG